MGAERKMSSEYNRKLNDSVFCNHFEQEWNDITTKLKQAHKESKIKKEIRKQNNAFRPTSSSVVFR